MTIWQKIETRLVMDWRESWRWWSVRFGAAGAVLFAASDVLRDAWQYVPPDLRSYLPYAQYISYALFGLGFVSRFIKQPERHGG